MSGHSKWSKIQHKKGKNDAKRGNIFTKLGKAVTIAAQQGGGDPEMNFSLRLAIDKAKSANMPKDNIERAIKRGTGEGKENLVLQELLYEGFGSGGVAMLIEVVTDNNNRSIADIKGVMNKLGGSLGGPGSVKWQFENKGVFLIGNEQLTNGSIDKDDFSLQMMDAGIEDIKESEEGFELISSRENFQKVSEAISSLSIEPDDSGLQWIAKETVGIADDKVQSMTKLVEALEELDDVSVVYTNL